MLALIDVILHLDQYLDVIIENYGLWIYILLFLVIFLETALVITPFLPGDSLLFIIGTFAARGVLDIFIVIPLLVFAAVSGDTVNYWIGSILGKRVFSGHIPFLKQEYLIRTQRFYQRHGSKTIVLARFIPIIRTFAPFVAGIATMRYGTFALYNVVGGILWIFSFVLGGYYFGNIPTVKEHFAVILLGIIVISLLPAMYHAWMERNAQ